MKKEKICPKCEKGKLVTTDDIISEIEGYIFVEKGERCSNCSEEFIPEQEGKKMIEIAKRLGLWGEPLKLYRKLSRSARGIILRIPTDIEKCLHLKGDENVALSKVGNKIVVEISS